MVTGDASCVGIYQAGIRLHDESFCRRTLCKDDADMVSQTDLFRFVRSALTYATVSTTSICPQSPHGVRTESPNIRAAQANLISIVRRSELSSHTRSQLTCALQPSMFNGSKTTWRVLHVHKTASEKSPQESPCGPPPTSPSQNLHAWSS